MEIAGYGLTDVGSKRTHNEDFMAYDDAIGLYVVCDGMGGAEAGEIAAERAATTVHHVVRQGIQSIGDGAGGVSSDAMVALLRTAIETACAAVYDEAATDIAKKGMGCTCISALVAGGKAVMGHVGDSRLYLARGGQVTQLSEDHTFINEAVKQGVFTAEEAAECGYKNVITRAIGKERNVIVDTLVFDLVYGDTLLLCSDGLHGYTKDNEELAALLSVPHPDAIPLRLVQIANERGGQDNITALIIRPKETAANAHEAQRSGDVIRGLEALRNIDLMKDLAMAEIVRFKQIFYEANFAAGDVVVREGEVNENLFVIVLGSAEVLRGEHRVAVLPAGAHFGEMSLLNSRPRSATVRAIEPCQMLTVDRDRLYGFLQQDGMLAAKLFWKLASTLAKRLDDVLAQQAEQAAQQAQQLAMQQSAAAGYYSGIYNQQGR